MKRVLIIQSTDDSVQEVVKGLEAGFKNQGLQVDLEEIVQRTRPLSFHPYDLVVVASPTLGFFGGKIDDQLGEFLKHCKRTSGQKAVAVVNSKLFGTGKSAKKVMEKLEEQGCVVKDFRVFKGYKPSKQYALDFSL